jgi:hypothetical protein
MVCKIALHLLLRLLEFRGGFGIIGVEEVEGLKISSSIRRRSIVVRHCAQYLTDVANDGECSGSDQTSNWSKANIDLEGTLVRARQADRDDIPYLRARSLRESVGI